MAGSLKQTAIDIVSFQRLPADPEAAADAVTKMVRDEHPTATLVAAQNAARRALGLGSVAATFTEYQGEVDASKRAAAKRKKRGVRAARKLAARPGIGSLGAAGASSPGGLIAQALGLILLYFVLRNASSAAELLQMVRRGVEWVVTPIPLGGSTQ